MRIASRAVAVLAASLGMLMPVATAVGQVTTPYPQRTAMQIKGVFADHQAWGGMNFVQHVAGNRGANTRFDLYWSEWQGEQRSVATCTGPNSVVFENTCFSIPVGWDSAIRSFTNAGVNVSAAVFGTPGWAQDPRCAGTDWCPPAAEKTADFRRFVRFMARRYNGQSGNGRVVDFIIGNEVNLSAYWADPSCQQQSNSIRVNCSRSQWIANYANYFANAYDVIKEEQSNARVMIPLTSSFFPESSSVETTTQNPSIDGIGFVTGVVGRIGNREWFLAMHPYSRYTGDTAFSVLDYEPGFTGDPLHKGYVTFGNIGAVSGWLAQAYPNASATSALYLTEQGFSSAGQPNGPFTSTPAAQANALCRSNVNVLGTPPIATYIYHRLIDNGGEAGLSLGLWSNNTTQKQAWALWATMDASSGPVCGYEFLPYTRLVRSYNPIGRHWMSSRAAPAGYAEESGQAWKLTRNPSAANVASMRMLYECGVTQANGRMEHTFITADRTCGQPVTQSAKAHLPLGPIGYAWKDAGSGRTALYSCSVANGVDHIVSPQSGCEGQNLVEMLGYANQ